MKLEEKANKLPKQLFDWLKGADIRYSSMIGLGQKKLVYLYDSEFMYRVIHHYKDELPFIQVAVTKNFDLWANSTDATFGLNCKTFDEFYQKLDKAKKEALENTWKCLSEKKDVEL